ncbi:MAG: DUF523 domain-containing protein [Blastocatellia bacterium]
MNRVLISACLLGEPVRYNGRDVPTRHEILARWHAEGRLVSICPEVAGGLPVPRPPAEILNGDGLAVLESKAKVMTKSGDDVTAVFLKGAYEALTLAQEYGCRVAILTEKSPSCGSSLIHDGTFSPGLRQGRGVTAALLEKNGVRVFNQHQFEQAAKCLLELEPSEIDEQRRR